MAGASGKLGVGSASNDPNIYDSGASLGVGTHTATFKATSTTTYVQLYAFGVATNTANWDNVSIKQTGNLVENGDFNSGVTDGWALQNGAVLTVSGGELNVENGIAAFGYAYQNVTVVIGNTYVAQIGVNYTADQARVRLGSTTGGSEYFEEESIAVDKTITETIVATSTTLSVRVGLQDNLAGSNADFDNISVRLADPDRSVNANGLEVHGQLTKAAVATGSELVAYSGFSVDDYLEQPYNADLDFGAGDFYWMYWFKATGSGYHVQRREITPSGNHFYSRMSAGLLKAIIFSTSGTEVSSTTDVSDDVWRLAIIVRESSVVSLYLNDVVEDTLSESRSITANDQVLRLGLSVGAGQPGPVDMALFRIGAGAPSAEQIKEIYEFERKLFEPNAACTLSGTSDDVKALAYDSDTGELYVASATDLSVFVGGVRTGEENAAYTSLDATGGQIAKGS